MVRFFSKIGTLFVFFCVTSVFALVFPHILSGQEVVPERRGNIYYIGDNRLPTQPVITGPGTVTAGVPHSFRVHSADPDGDAVRYEIYLSSSRNNEDLEADPAPYHIPLDQSLPGGSYIEGGVDQDVSMTWNKPGKKSLRVCMKDEKTGRTSIIPAHGARCALHTYYAVSNQQPPAPTIIGPFLDPNTRLEQAPRAGQEHFFDIYSPDPEGELVQYVGSFKSNTRGERPQGGVPENWKATTLLSTTQRLRIGPVSFATAGTKTLKACAYDVANAASTQNGSASASCTERTYTVLGENHPPTAPIITNSPASAAVNQPYSFTFHADDPDGDSLAYVWRVLDEGLDPYTSILPRFTRAPVSGYAGANVPQTIAHTAVTPGNKTFQVCAIDRPSIESDTQDPQCALQNFTVAYPLFNIDVSQHSTDLLLHFDNAANPFIDSSGSDSQLTYYLGSPLPDFTEDGRFSNGGALVDQGAVRFTGSKRDGERRSIFVPVNKSNFAFGAQDLTIDFWVFPEELENRTLFFEMHTLGRSPLPLLRLVNSASRGNTPHLYYYSSGQRVFEIFGGAALKLNEWNHLAFQRKNEGGKDYVSLAVNGRFGEWTALLSPVAFEEFSALVFGWTYRADVTDPAAFRGKIDEFRIVKGKALWGEAQDGQDFVPPAHPAKSFSAVSLPSRPGDAIPFEAVQAPERQAEADAIPQEQEEVAKPAPPTSLPVSEARQTTTSTLIRSLSGDLHYTVNYDQKGVILSVDYWAEDTGDKKLKVFEYNALGEIFKETYFAPSGEATDIVIYYPKTQGGGEFSDLKIRKDENGVSVQTLSHFDEQGRLVYSHRVSGAGNYAYVKTNTFSPDTGKLDAELTYFAPADWERAAYVYNESGALREKRITTRVPAAIDGSDVFYSVLTLSANEEPVHTRRLSASFGGQVNKIEEVAYNSESRGGIETFDAFDYLKNLKTRTRFKEIGANAIGPQYVFAAQIDLNSSPLAFSEYEYEAEAVKKIVKTEFIGGNVKLPESVTEYNGQGIQTKKTAYTYYAGTVGQWEKVTLSVFDEKGNIASRTVYPYPRTGGVAQTARMLDKDGLVTGAVTYDAEGRVAGMKYYRGGETPGSQWFERAYAGSSNSGDCTITDFLVEDLNNDSVIAAAEKIRWKSARYAKCDEATAPSEEEIDRLAKKKMGDAIVASLPLPSSGELPRIAEAVLELLTQYKTAVTQTGLSEAKKRYLYQKYVMRLTYAIYSIEHAAWGMRGLTDDRALEQTATSWVGTDRVTGGPFHGFYIFPGNSRDNAAYVDFDDPSGSISRAGSYDQLKTIPKKLEKWDAEPKDIPIKWSAASGGTAYHYNEASTGFLSIDELTKPDPSIALLVDRMFADLEAKKITLSGRDEEETIKAVYEYFYHKSLFSYLNDLGDSVQTVGETFARGGGDCEDFGTVLLSILREVFRRLDNTSVASRLGLAVGTVSESDAISTGNPGVGHASVLYKAPGPSGSYSYIEASHLFLGAGKNMALNRAGILKSAPLTDGKLTGQTDVVPGKGWYFAFHTFAPIEEAGVRFAGAPTPVAVNKTAIKENSATRVIKIPSHIEPYNRKIIALADYLIPYIPLLAEQTPQFIAGYLHNEFAKMTAYTPDGAIDVWKTVDATLAVPTLAGLANGTQKITGDCEDLAFIEASVLQNVLTVHYMLKGDPPHIAAAKAQSHVYLVAEREYKGVKGAPSHLYAAFVNPEGRGSGATVVLLDPQSPAPSPERPFEAVLNDQYLFYANTAGISAVSFYDWQTLRLSAAAVNTSVNPVEHVAPVAPTTGFGQKVLNAVKAAAGNVLDGITTLAKAVKDGPKSIVNAMIGVANTFKDAMELVIGRDIPDIPSVGQKPSADASQVKTDSNLDHIRFEGKPTTVSPDVDDTSATQNMAEIGSGKTHTITTNRVSSFFQSGGEAIKAAFTPNDAGLAGQDIPLGFPGSGTPGEGSLPRGTPVTVDTSIGAGGRDGAMTIVPNKPPEFKSVHYIGSSLPGGGIGSIRFDPVTNTLYSVQPMFIPNICELSTYTLCAYDKNYASRAELITEGSKERPFFAQYSESTVCALSSCAGADTLYHKTTECPSGYKSERVEANMTWIVNNKEQSIPKGSYVCLDRGNTSPTPPTICGPTKGFKDTPYRYTFTASDADLSGVHKDSKGNLILYEWGKIRYGISFDEPATDAFYEPAEGYLPRSSDTSKSVVGSSTKSWATAGAKSVNVKAQDARPTIPGESGTTKLPVTIGDNATTIKPVTAGACGTGALTVNWESTGDFNVDEFNLYYKKAAEADSAFVKLNTSPISASARSFAATGLTNGEEYTFGLVSAVSDSCGAKTAIATTTANAFAPAACSLDLTAVINRVSGTQRPPYLTDTPRTPAAPPTYNTYRGSSVTVFGTIDKTGAGSVKEAYSGTINKTDIDGAPSLFNAALFEMGPDEKFTKSLLSEQAVSLNDFEYSTTSRFSLDGSYTYKLCADSAGTITESDEDNNCSAPVTIKVEPRRKPAVELYISPTGDCGSVKGTEILKGSPARLCWSTGIEPF